MTNRYPCLYCDKSYITAEQLARHIAKEHPGMTVPLAGNLSEEDAPPADELAAAKEEIARLTARVRELEEHPTIPWRALPPQYQKTFDVIGQPVPLRNVLAYVTKDGLRLEELPR